MRLDRKNLRLHVLWATPALALTVGLGLWYAQASIEQGHWLRGGSLPGLVCGIVAGSIIAFEMLLWPRKLLRAWRLIAAKHWLAAHLWFGLASLPLAYIHCGFHFGGLLPTLLICLFTLTILSGIVGWCLQHFIPKLMLRNIPAETICSQIPAINRQNLINAYSILERALGSAPAEIESPVPKTVASISEVPIEAEFMNHKSTAVVLETRRDVGRIRGRTLHTTKLTIEAHHATFLWSVYKELSKYLQHGKRSQGELVEALRASAYFEGARAQCGASCHELLSTLEGYCNERRQFDLQIKLNTWLHGWLPVHIGLSVSVTLLLIGHIITALRY